MAAAGRSPGESVNLATLAAGAAAAHIPTATEKGVDLVMEDGDGPVSRPDPIRIARVFDNSSPTRSSSRRKRELVACIV